MELHHIRYFCVLARELNYSAAAEKCFISRQALRQSVQCLEKEYHVSLIENRHNHLSLTPAGQVFLEGAERILKDYNELNQRLQGLEGNRLPLRVGISVSLVPFYAPEVMAAISRLQETPQFLELELQIKEAESLLQDLREDRLDAAILVDMGCLNEGWYRAVLREDKVHISFSVTHPFMKKEIIHMEDLDGMTMVLMSDPAVFFLPFYERAKMLPNGLKYQVVPECFEAFHRIRHDEIIGLDREDAEPVSALDLEATRPLMGFTHKLEAVLLAKENPRDDVFKLAKYVSRRMSSHHE